MTHLLFTPTCWVIQLLMSLQTKTTMCMSSCSTSSEFTLLLKQLDCWVTMIIIPSIVPLAMQSSFIRDTCLLAKITQFVMCPPVCYHPVLNRLIDSRWTHDIWYTLANRQVTLWCVMKLKEDDGWSLCFQILFIVLTSSMNPEMRVNTRPQQLATYIFSTSLFP